MEKLSARVLVNAKANLSLYITGRDGGFHTLDMVTTTLEGISDAVTVTLREDTAVVFRSRVPLPEDNTAVRAARAYLEKFRIPRGVTVEVEKGIPIAAGLGGSSADAAGVILCMQELFGKRSEEELTMLCMSVGSDTLLMTENGFARVRGRGEKVERFRIPHPLHVVVCKPAGGVSTKEAYDRFDKLGAAGRDPKNDELIRMLCEGRLHKPGLFVNDLYPAACELNPEILRLTCEMQKTAPISVVMTGSGSALIGIYTSVSKAQAAAESLKDSAQFVRAAVTADFLGGRK